MQVRGDDGRTELVTLAARVGCMRQGTAFWFEQLRGGSVNYREPWRRERLGHIQTVSPFFNQNNDKLTV